MQIGKLNDFYGNIGFSYRFNETTLIPECMENIRKIQIYLGDATTAAVVRSKIAKRKMQEAAA